MNKEIIRNETNDSKSPFPELIEGSVQSITPHNEAVYEAGKELLKNSPDTGRDFCKFMTTISIGAIPIYLSILALTLPEGIILLSLEIVLIIIPAILFLISTIIFILGLLPQKVKFSLDNLTKTREILDDITTTRKKVILIGVSFFVLSVIISCATVFLNLF